MAGSTIELDRMFLQYILNALNGKIEPEKKEILINQIKSLIKKNSDEISTKAENGTINKSLV